jgi:hypothetical protein
VQKFDAGALNTPDFVGQSRKIRRENRWDYLRH